MTDLSPARLGNDQKMTGAAALNSACGGAVVANSICSGNTYSYRVDTGQALTWIAATVLARGGSL